MSTRVVRAKGSKQSTKRYMRKSVKPRSTQSASLMTSAKLTASDERRIDRFVDWFVDRLFGDRS